MPTGIFEFQTLLTSAVNGISGSILGTEQGVSYVLMTICLVLGDLRGLYEGRRICAHWPGHF